MSIIPRALSWCLAEHSRMSQEITLTSTASEVPFAHIRWPGVAKHVYALVTQRMGSRPLITVGYAVNGGNRTVADPNYYVESTGISMGHQIGSVLELTIPTGQDRIVAGEIITYTVATAATTTSKCYLQFCWEYLDQFANDEPVGASTSTTTTTSSSTSTSSTTSTTSTSTSTTSTSSSTSTTSTSTSSTSTSSTTTTSGG